MTRLCAVALFVLMVCGASISAQDMKGTASAAKAASSAATLVNLNTATAAQLEGLPGIGKSTADRIVEYRQKSGGFKKIEELMNVRGIGEKSFLKLKPLITVSAPKSDRAASQ